MKLLAIILFIALLISCSSLQRLEKLQSKEWTLQKQSHKISFSRRDSMVFLCCQISPIYHPDTLGEKYVYWIEIEMVDSVDLAENKKRKAQQSLILDSLKKQSSQSKLTYHHYHSFLFKRNIMANLRVPVGIKHGQSVYVKDALEEMGAYNLYFKDVRDVMNIVAFRKKVFRALKLKYQTPNWYDEYIMSWENYRKSKMDMEF
jgi:hypothetical protein